MRTALIMLGSALFTLLAIAVWNGTQSPDCEALYNEMTNASNAQLQQAMMNHGYEVGCFHSN